MNSFLIIVGLLVIALICGAILAAVEDKIESLEHPELMRVVKSQGFRGEEANREYRRRVRILNEID